MRAPMSLSGAATRSIGRWRSEASPVSSLSNGCPASSPISSRIPVPELPRSRTLVGARSPRAPAPSIRTKPSGLRSMATPMASRAPWVARQSSLARKPCTTVVPSAIAPSISARCEMDLSPATVIRPPMCVVGTARKRFGCCDTALGQRMAFGNEPSTLNNDAFALISSSALRTCSSSAWPSRSKKKT